MLYKFEIRCGWHVPGLNMPLVAAAIFCMSDQIPNHGTFKLIYRD